MPTFNRQIGNIPKVGIKPGAIPIRKGTPPVKAPMPTGAIARIKDVEFSDDDPIRIMLYGDSGTGKTTLWGTFPKPILAILCSGTLRTGELKSLRHIPKGQIKQFVVKHSSEMVEIIEHARATEKYKTIVMDHVTGFENKVLAEVMGVEEIPQQKSWGMATREQYGQVSIICKTIFRELLDIPANIVMIGQERDDSKEGQDVGVPTVGIACGPSLANWLNPAVDYICQTFKRNKVIKVPIKIGKETTFEEQTTDEIEFCLRTGPHQHYTTKFRKPKWTELPTVMADPTYEKIMEIINAKK